MDASVILGFIGLGTVFVTGIATPVAVGYFNYRIRKNEFNDAKKRLDIVDAKLDTVHSLVNSRLTVVLQSLHDALTAQLTALRNMTTMREQIGYMPNVESKTIIAALEKRIIKLAEIISERTSGSETALELP